MSIPGLTAPVDTALRSFWKKNANVAEVFTKVFDLREPINPELLQERDSVESAVLEQSKGRYLTLYGNRDTLRFLPMGEKETKKGVLLAIENQSWIDHQMPLRLLRYDLISYASQASYLWNHQMEEKGTNDVDESERLSRFRKDDQIHAVVTLVIYYGKEPWEKPLSLKMMFGEPGNQLSGFANDYPFRLIDVRRLGKEQIEAFAGEVKALFGFVRYSEEWEILPVFVETNRDVFQTLSMEATVAILKVTKSRKLNQYLKKWKKEEEQKAGESGKEAFDMCKALDDMCEHAKAEGAREGRIEGERVGEMMLEQLIRKLLADNRTAEIEKAAVDRTYRKKLYRFYGIR